MKVLATSTEFTAPLGWSDFILAVGAVALMLLAILAAWCLGLFSRMSDARRRWFRLSIRELASLFLAFGFALAWWNERRSLHELQAAMFDVTSGIDLIRSLPPDQQANSTVVLAMQTADGIIVEGSIHAGSGPTFAAPAGSPYYAPPVLSRTVPPPAATATP